MPNGDMTLNDAFDYFKENVVRSPRTIETYTHAINHFLKYLENSAQAKNISISGPSVRNRSLRLLGTGSDDVNILWGFVGYLSNDVKLNLQASSIRVYCQGMNTVFQFLFDKLLLPVDFQVERAIAKSKKRIRQELKYEGRIRAPDPPEGMIELIHSFDNLEIDQALPKNEQHRQMLESMRNKAVLAEKSRPCEITSKSIKSHESSHLLRINTV
jgi:hypothetical protein